MTLTLQAIADELRALESEGEKLTYHVPCLWTPVGTAPVGEPRAVNPYRFHLDHVQAILESEPAVFPQSDRKSEDKIGDWVRDAIIYNVFVRLTTAYDHARDGVIGTPHAHDTASRTLNAQGVRESGTFLKTIALLGHIRSLGATAIHVLPVTAVGRFGNKGNLGSPYAIRNPYELEPTLADPLISADAATQFRGLVEACHRLGMRVIVELVFRTSSRDADWIPQHPDWFYWIERGVEDRPPDAPTDDHRYFGAPPFGDDALRDVNDKVASGDLSDLPQPPAWYRGLFTSPPRPTDVVMEQDGRYVGTLWNGRRVHVPSAFADWPPDDVQPPWTDVTYLRVFNDPTEGPSFNYIAYNTIRMYDERLASAANANAPLWAAVRGILPHHQRSYGIDGCMVDMGHALPSALMQGLVEEARRHHPDFALLSEDFVVGEDSVRTGYNAVLGYQFRAVETAAEMRALIERTCVEGLPIPAFGTGETHNTPRVAMRNRGRSFCRSVWLINCFLPDTIPFVHGGFELGEEQPVNLGLGFSPHEIRTLQQTALGLFDLTSLHWDEAGQLPREIGRIAVLRETYSAIAHARGEGSFAWLDAGTDDILAFRRTDVASGQTLVLIVEWRCSKPRPLRVKTEMEAVHFEELLSSRTFEAPEGTILGTLQPGEGLILRALPPPP